MTRVINSIIFILLSYTNVAVAQQQDTATTLNAEEYIAIVKQYHPIVLQMQIAMDKADAAVLSARGAFDPVINSYLTQKSLDNVNYYNIANHSISIPMWYGINVKAGVNRQVGDRINSERTQGASGFVGLNIDLLNNFIIDKRRADIRKAYIYRDMTEAERRMVVNDLLYQAAKAYWEWAQAYRNYLITTSLVSNSRARYEWTVQSVLNGERAGIDSVEARAQYLTLYNLQTEALQQYRSKTIDINAYLWTADQTPFVLPRHIVPSVFWSGELSADTLSLTRLIDDSHASHPELAYYRNKDRVLNINRKLMLQEMLPKISAYYYHHDKSYNAFQAPFMPLVDNYQYGLKLSMPLFLSKQRAAYKMARLDISENNLLINYKTNQIENKVRTSYIEYLQYRQQIAIQEDVVALYRRLLTGEQTLFQNGESSSFMINSRENKLLESEQKLNDLYVKYYKSLYGLMWSVGVL